MSLPTPTVINLTAGGTNNIACSGAGSINSAGGNVNLTTLGAITSGTGTTDIFAGAGTVSIAGGSGIGSSGNPFVVSGNNLDATTSGNGNEFLSRDRIDHHRLDRPERRHRHGGARWRHFHARRQQPH